MGTEILYRGHRNLELDIISTRSIMYCMDPFISVEDSHVDVLHEISVRLGTADGFHDVLNRVVEFATALVKCDSCLVYVLEGDELVLRASMNPHHEVVDRLKLRVGRHYRMGGGAPRAGCSRRKSRTGSALSILPRTARRQLRGFSLRAA